MGRGRTKAKQQKVARELKYNSQFTDLDALQRELGVSDQRNGSHPAVERETDDDDYDDWAGSNSR